MALACRMQTFGANWIELQCCRGTQHLLVRRVLAADPHRGVRTLADFLIRLRSEACGARPASTVLIESLAGQAATRAGEGRRRAGG